MKDTLIRKILILNRLQKLYLLFFLMLMFVGCSKLGSLNMESHYFGTLPIRVVWIQVPGFNESQLGIFKFSGMRYSEELALEKNSCLGKTWQYNIYDFRPDWNSGLLTQLTGKMNISNTCKDYDHRPIWKYFKESGHEAGVLEVGIAKYEGIDGVLKCDKQKTQYFNELTYFKMAQDKENEFQRFYVDAKISYEPGNIYFDRSCQSDQCYSDTFENLKYTFEEFTKNKKRYFFLMRYKSLHDAIVSKDWKKLHLTLEELSKIYDYFQKIVKQDSNIMFILSSTRPYEFEYPTENGQNQWKSFSSDNHPLQFKSSSVMGTVLATGARAENFCGIYEESDIFKRMLVGPKKFKWK